MNITKYQSVDLRSKFQNPEDLREDFRNLLSLIKPQALKNENILRTYNLLCGIEALLCRYETVSKETLLILAAADDEEQSLEYLSRLHKNALHQQIYNSKMIF